MTAQHDEQPTIELPPVDDAVPPSDPDSGPESGSSAYPQPSARSYLATKIRLILVAGVVFTVALLDHQRLAERETAAETKYGVEFVKRVRNRESSVVWRFFDGHLAVCQISGDRDDPTLRCGIDQTEPPLGDVYDMKFNAGGDRS